MEKAEGENRKHSPGKDQDAIEGVFFAKLKIMNVKKERLGDIIEADAQAEGGYTVDTFRQVWVLINGSWEPETMVYVVTFEKVD